MPSVLKSQTMYSGHLPVTWTPLLYLSSKPYIGLILMPSTTSSWILSLSLTVWYIPPSLLCSCHNPTPPPHWQSLTLVQVTFLLDQCPPTPILQMPYTQAPCSALKMAFGLNCLKKKKGKGRNEVKEKTIQFWQIILLLNQLKLLFILCK